MKPPTPKTTQSSSSNQSTPSFSSPHHPAYAPQSHNFGESPIPLPPGKSHMEALRAHAHSASSGIGHHSTEPGKCIIYSRSITTVLFMSLMFARKFEYSQYVIDFIVVV